jgi:hypothetical protein
MNNLFLFAAHNTVVALVLALFVYGLTRVWFGGNYFGTGDSVLKRWWGLKSDEL